jgi:hypothetical protein
MEPLFIKVDDEPFFADFQYVAVSKSRVPNPRLSRSS